jgi:hypothetical protein
MSDTGVLVSLDEEGLKSRLILDYTNRDFTGIRSELIRLAHTMMPEWKTVGESSDFGTVLLELYAYMGDIMNYYIDRVASEAFLATAIRPQSVWYIADMLGYKPTAQAAATVTLTITAYEPAPEDPMEPIIIPANTKVYTSSDTSGEAIVFETIHQVSLLPGEVTTVVAEEGVTVMDQKVGVSFGISNTEFVLQQKGIIAGSIRVVSTEGYQSVTWLYTTDLATARPTQSVFTTYVDDFNFTHIVFGDNTSGRIPAANAQIFATYRYGVGAQANSIPTKKITTIVPRAGFFEAWQVTVTNLEAPTGGADPESVDSLRHTIPRAGGRIRSRAVTLNDYADLAMQVPGVAKSVAYGTVYTAVKVWIGPSLSSSQDTCSDEMMERLCANVEQTMKDKVLIGSTVVAGPPMCDDLWTNIFIRVNIQVSEVFNRLSVRDQVDSVIRKLLSYAEVDFGTRVTLGGIYRAALTVNGVEWAEVTWLSTIRPPSESGGVYVEPTITPTGPPTGGPVQTLFTSQWKFESITSPAEPTATYYRLTDDPGSADAEFTHIAISRRDTTAPSAGSDNRGTNLASLDVGDHIVMSNPANGSWWDYVIRSNVTPHAGTGAPATPGYDEWDITLARTSAPVVAPAVNTPIDFTFVRYSPTPISIGEVADINTDDLHIPRIDPVKYEEEPENYPDHYIDAELIHDGLWITADGGLANT